MICCFHIHLAKINANRIVKNSGSCVALTRNTHAGGTDAKQYGVITLKHMEQYLLLRKKIVNFLVLLFFLLLWCTI